MLLPLSGLLPFSWLANTQLLFTRLSADEHLGGFDLLAIMNNHVFV